MSPFYLIPAAILGAAVGCFITAVCVAAREDELRTENAALRSAARPRALRNAAINEELDELRTENELLRRRVDIWEGE